MDRLTYKNRVENTNELYCEYENCDVLEDSCPLCQDDCIVVRNAINKLAYYEDLIEQGKMIELPCKVGDKLWCINDYSKIEEVECIGFIVTSQINIIYQEKFAEDEYNMPLNSVIFLTREQADEKLKERER